MALEDVSGRSQRPASTRARAIQSIGGPPLRGARPLGRVRAAGEDQQLAARGSSRRRRGGAPPRRRLRRPASARRSQAAVGIVSPPPSGASRRPAVPSSPTSSGGAPAAGLAAEVGDADDRELEALRAVDRHQADGVQALGFERGLALARLGEVAGLGVGEEAAEVAALGAFVLAREAHELAQVREPAVAAGPRERGQVVARWRRSRARAAPRAARARRARARRRAAAPIGHVAGLERGPEAAAARAPRPRAGRARRCPRRGTARTGRSAAPPRRAGSRARAATRGRRGPAPGDQ